MSRRGTVALSFSGSGLLLVYQLGATKALLRDAAWSDAIGAVAGVSGGAITAAAVALLRPEQLDSFAGRVVASRDGAATLRAVLGKGCPRPNHLPLFVGTTECETGRAALFSRFGTRSGSDLALSLVARVIRASCTIPLSSHPFDLWAWTPNTYPEREGVMLPRAAEYASSSSPSEGEAAHVDGGFSTAAPVLPPSTGFLATLTVSPIAGPSSPLHLCPADASLKIPFLAPRLGGLRCYLSAANARAARQAMGPTVDELRAWYERGIEDAKAFAARHRPPDAKEPLSSSEEESLVGSSKSHLKT